jgi:hypothetical protein
VIKELSYAIGRGKEEDGRKERENLVDAPEL